VTQAGDHGSLSVGERSFFFDVLGTLDKISSFTSGDFFADKDTCSIVLEVPNSLLAERGWAVGSHVDSNGPVRVGAGSKRIAGPAQPTPFLPASRTTPISPGSQRTMHVSVPVFAHALGAHGRVSIGRSKAGG